MNKLLLFGIIFLLFSCSKKSTKVDTNQIWQQYRIVYNETDYTTFVGCKIRKEKKNGKGIKFIDGDYLSIMGAQMKYGFGLYEYGETYNNTFIDSVYIDILHKGVKVSNFFKFADVRTCSIPLSETTIYYGLTWIFTWDGPPLQSDEKITLQLFDSEGASVYFMESGPTDLTYMVLVPSSYEDKVQPGVSYKMRVTRERTTTLTMYTGSGGDAELAYIDEENVSFY